MLIAGDTHIPTRARRIPPRIESVMRDNSPYDCLLFTGDLVSEKVIDMLRQFSERLYIVRGNMDYIDLPEHVYVDLEGMRTVVIHGHQVYPRGNVEGLYRIAVEMDADILVSGHTHYGEVREVVKGGRRVILVNPGSLTGVWSGGIASMRPSFIICNVTGDSVEFVLYEEFKDEVRSRRFEFPRRARG